MVDAVSDTIYKIADSMNLLIAGFEAAQIAGDRAFDPSSVNEMRAAIEQVYGSTDAIKSALIPPTPPEPVKWKLANPNTQVFMNTGIDRYQQEIQSANALLQQLANTQESIATQADSTNIFYGDATADLTALNGRIVNIQQRILQMQSQPVTDIIDGTVNSQLERLRSQLSTAVQEQSELNNAVQNLDVSAANTAYQRLSATIGNTEQYIRDNIGEQEQFNETINAGSGSCDNLTKKIAGIAASYLSIQAIGNTIKNAVNLSDTITQTTARLDMMNDDLQTTQDLQNMIYLSAQRSRGSYQETADAVAKMGVMAGDAFKSNEELVAFSEQLNKQFAIAGTAPEGISAAMLQLTQAMGSGVLRGEELNSVFDQAPTIVQSIADYIGVDIGQIRELAQEGKITAETVKNAMLSSAEETNAAFENMPLTFGQIATQIQNDALMIFQPILDKLSEIANSEDFSKMMNSVINTLAFVSGIVATLFDLIVQVGSFAFDNWSILQPIILGIAIALTIYTAVLAIYNTQKAITAMREKIHAAATMMSTGATFAATAAQHGLNAALLACPITWILLIIIAVIAAIYAIVAAINKVTGSTLSATGIICGAIAVAGASIWNLIVGVVNAIIGIGVELWNLIAVFANFFANVFNDPVGAIITLFSGMFDFILGIVQEIAKLIDTVIGTDMAGAVAGFRNTVAEKTAEIVGDQVVVMEKLNAADYQLDGLDYGDAWNAGYNLGEGIDNKVSNLFNADMLPKESNYPPNDYGPPPYEEQLNNIDENTGDTKKAVELTDEDLKYMRDIAETEAINRFTTAEVKVDFSGMTNRIDSSMDLDGVVARITDGLSQAIDMTAEGVHV